MKKLGNYIFGSPDRQPPDLDELAQQHDGFGNIPVIVTYSHEGDVRTVEFTAETLMRAWCKDGGPESISDEEWREALQNIIAGKGHGG